MKRTLVLFLLAAGSLFAQTQLSLLAPPPNNVSNVAVSGGASGSGTYWYWVVTRYPIGKVLPNGPAIAIAKAAPTAGVPLVISWSPVSGASSYDILRTSTAATPTGTCTCAVATAQTGSTVNDTGAALSSYTVTSDAGAASATFTLNNRDGTAPFINVNVSPPNTNYKSALVSPTAVVGQNAIIGANGVINSAGAPVGDLHSITFVIDGGGSPILTGDLKDFPTANFACTISRIDISADVAGSITVDIWKRAGAIPTSAQKISASAPLTLSAAQLNQNGSLTGWTTAVAVGDVFGGTVATAATVTHVIGQIWCQ